MRRIVISILILVGMVLAACSGGDDSSTATSVSSPATGKQAASGGGTSRGDAAAKLTDACSVIGDEFVQRFVPAATKPERQQFPLQCMYLAAQSGLVVTFDDGPDDPVKGAESVSGLADGGYLERLDPNSKGDVYLTVILGKDKNGSNHNLHVAIAGHDGKDHKDDAVALARDILSRLN